MPDTKISGLASLAGALAVASGDLFVMVDVSDTSMAASGTDKQITAADLAANLGFSVATIAADFPINAGAANALTDITGLSFAVVTGKTYYFRFAGIYTAGASTTGSRWTINGPAMNWLFYESKYQLTATTYTTNTPMQAVQLPAASNATSNVATGGANFVLLEGMCNPSANGTLQIQGAREVTTDTVTLKAGSLLQYKQTA